MLQQISMNTTVQDSLCPVGPEDVKVQQEGAACCCVCRTCAPACMGEKHIARASSDLRQDVDAPLT
jgi:hypothetical protein